MVETSGPRVEGQSVVVAGASGLIGRELCHALAERGHHVSRLVRRAPRDPNEHEWNPRAGKIQSGIISHVDAVVNLSGASIGRIPWTAGYKKTILDSRIDTTRTLVQAMSATDTPPKTFIQASAVGIYGDRGNIELTEKTERGEGFLADVVEAWEAETTPLAHSDTRVVLARTGLVVARGGAMAPLAFQTKLGVAGRIGPGTQWWPWISVRDEVEALIYLIENPLTSGPYNLVGPTAATSEEVTRTLAELLRRPYWLGLPTLAIRVLMGEAGVNLLLTSQKVTPQKLIDAGFRFQDTRVKDALAQIV